MAAAKISVVPPPAPAAIDPKDLPPVFLKEEPSSIAELRIMQRHVQAIIRQVSPAVVAVEIGEATGSGVIISAGGLVLTAGHVCGAPNRDVLFTFPDGKTARGKTLGINENDDTGLMRITDPGPWPYAPLGDLKRARLGDWTLALGNPGGFDLKRSLVTRLGRIIRLAPDFVQTDCTLSPGDSGGPLFDMYGRVIAIHVAISSSITANFHVPMTEFYDDWSQLISGIRVQETPEDVSQAYTGATVVDDDQGCRVTAIVENSPAALVGLKINDIILKVEGRTVKKASFFKRSVEESAPGDTLDIQVKRGSTILHLNLTLAPLPEDNE